MITDLSMGKCELLGRSRSRLSRKINKKIASWREKKHGKSIENASIASRGVGKLYGDIGVELMGAGLFQKIKRAAAAIATGGVSEAVIRAKEKPAIAKAITRAVVAVATGGASEAGRALSKNKDIARAAVAVVTGGASEIGRGLAKSKTARRVVAGVITGGASEAFAAKGKSGNVARALMTGGASLLFQKNKAGNIARTVAGYVFAPITTSIVGAVKKSKARKAAAAESEAAAQVELDRFEKEEQAAAPSGGAAGVAAPGSKNILPLLALGAVALPFLFGND